MSLEFAQHLALLHRRVNLGESLGVALDVGSDSFGKLALGALRFALRVNFLDALGASAKAGLEVSAGVGFELRLEVHCMSPVGLSWTTLLPARFPLRCRLSALRWRLRCTVPVCAFPVPRPSPVQGR